MLDRMKAEVDRGNDAEGAEAAGHELMEIVAGDIFNNLAAGFCDGAVGEHDGHADDEVAQGAILQAQRAAVVGGDDAADGGVAPARADRERPFGRDALSSACMAAQVLPASTVQVMSCQECSRNIFIRARLRQQCAGSTGLPQCSLVPLPAAVTISRFHWRSEEFRTAVARRQARRR